MPDQWGNIERRLRPRPRRVPAPGERLPRAPGELQRVVNALVRRMPRDTSIVWAAHRLLRNALTVLTGQPQDALIVSTLLKLLALETSAIPESPLDRGQRREVAQRLVELVGVLDQSASGDAHPGLAQALAAFEAAVARLPPDDQLFGSLPADFGPRLLLPLDMAVAGSRLIYWTGRNPSIREQFDRLTRTLPSILEARLAFSISQPVRQRTLAIRTWFDPASIGIASAAWNMAATPAPGSGPLAPSDVRRLPIDRIRTRSYSVPPLELVLTIERGFVDVVEAVIDEIEALWGFRPMADELWPYLGAQLLAAAGENPEDWQSSGPPVMFSERTVWKFFEASGEPDGPEGSGEY